jgi:hypothetical protein
MQYKKLAFNQCLIFGLKNGRSVYWLAFRQLAHYLQIILGHSMDERAVWVMFEFFGVGMTGGETYERSENALFGTVSSLLGWKAG